MLKAVFLDVDGTLIDSNDAHAESWAMALVENGYAADASQVRPLIGMGGDRLLPELIGYSEDSELGKKVSERRKQIFKEKFIDANQIQPFTGTRDLLLHLKAAGFKLYVSSSSDKETLTQLLKIARADDLIEESTSADDANSSKPSPDIINATLKIAGLRPNEAMLIGDTPYDIEAAARAGVSTVALLCGGGWSAGELRDAIAIYQDPADLLLHFETSPFGEAIRTEAQGGASL